MKQYQTVQEWLDEHIAIEALKAFKPSAIMKVVPNVTKEDVYNICEEYRKQGNLALQYELICPSCYHTLGVYETLSSMPRQIDCNLCDEEEIEPISNNFVFYKIVK